MNAYTPDAWFAAFAAIAGAAAALTGLLFVALSINLERVLKVEGLIGRAVEVLLLLGAVLIVSLLLLMPGQGATSAATEIVSVGVAAIVWLVWIHTHTPRHALGISRANFATRVAGAQLGPVVMLVGGIGLWTQSLGGLYWVVPGLIAAIVAAIIGAWVMLVEILR